MLKISHSEYSQIILVMKEALSHCLWGFCSSGVMFFVLGQ